MFQTIKAALTAHPLLAMTAALSGLIAIGVAADYSRVVPAEVTATFVGRDACIECHRDETAAFTGSHHDLAMDTATDDSVLGDFENAELTHHGITSRMFRDGDRFMVHTEGPTGRMEDFEIKYVFGVDPLQQYMVEFDRPDDAADDEIGRLQVLRISWDTHRKKWFYLKAPDVDEKIAPGDPLHWTGIAQRWQTMCADCHSTNLQPGYDVATGRYHTTYSEIDVSCEACHGPGSLHVDLANRKSLFWDRDRGFALASLKGENKEGQLQSCAPCHSRRGQLGGGYVAGASYHDFYQLEPLTEATYHADGQIKDEVYVYGSFTQSLMYHKSIGCTDCHDPHSLKLKHAGNETCTSCHQHAAGKYDVPSHHHHAVGTAGAACVNCHMPHTTYMMVDDRRDHSLRVPRPDLSVEIGTPNACSGCHIKDQIAGDDALKEFADRDYAAWLAAAESGNEAVAAAIAKTDRWCEDACQTWYGEARKTPEHYGQVLAALRAGRSSAPQTAAQWITSADPAVPDIAKASLIGEVAGRDPRVTLAVCREILAAATGASVQVRAAAARALVTLPPQRSLPLLEPLLTDDSVQVRTAAARSIVTSGGYASLHGSRRSAVDAVMTEVHRQTEITADRSGAHVDWALLSEARGQEAEAIESYQRAIKVEPTVAGPRTNLAALLERTLDQMPPAKAPAVADWVKRLRAEELPLLARDAALVPDIFEVQYRYGLALYLNGQIERSREQIERAVRLQPDHPEAAEVLRLLAKPVDP